MNTSSLSVARYGRLFVVCFVVSATVSSPLLPLDPGSDTPVIPAPSGSGIRGLYDSISRSTPPSLSFDSDVRESDTDTEPGDRVAVYGRRSKEEPRSDEVLIPSPASAQKSADAESQKAGQTRTTQKSDPEAKEGKRIVGFPSSLQPTPKKPFRYVAPDFYRGIYLNNRTIRVSPDSSSLLKEAASYGINTLVVDVQPRRPSGEFLRVARDLNFYLVARVVVFQGGLANYPPAMEHIQKVLDAAETAAKDGFMEIQLDYIRFSDTDSHHLSLKKRYRFIEGILKMATDRLRPYGVRIGADIFGRIAFNQNDTIGQKLEVFSPHLDTIYPMLYPSHFYGEPKKIKDPYGTVLAGTKNCIERGGSDTKIIAYIQGFQMKVRESGLSITDYIARQIKATKDSGGGGYIAWNSRNRYGDLFRAIEKAKRE